MGNTESYSAPPRLSERTTSMRRAPLPRPHPLSPSPSLSQSSQNLVSQSGRNYGFFGDDFNSLTQVVEALRKHGLESSNLIVGIDFTKSNEWTGKWTFGGRSLHSISDISNPYEIALKIIGKTLSSFDDDNLIPCYGFGDVSTHDELVFNFFSGGRPCHGFEEALSRYRHIVPHIRLSGPTSFAPIIEAAVRVVEESGGQFHVLLILADGQVTGSETENGILSPQEKNTISAITAASNYALSIVMVGIGDGPWETMKDFDDNIPQRNFDNFQFVDLSSIMMASGTMESKEAKFALSALMEIPLQYKACLELGLVGRKANRMPPRVPLPPPPSVLAAEASFTHSPSLTPSSVPPLPLSPLSPPPSILSHESSSSISYPSLSPLPPSLSAPHLPLSPFLPLPPLPPPPPPPPRDTSLTTRGSVPEEGGSRVCAICFSNPLNMAFQCGHQTCADCGVTLKDCPICRTQISTRIKLFF